MTTGLTEIAPEEIIKPHESYDKAHLEVIYTSMDENGWQGRPLLAIETYEGSVQAVTGTHRLTAADDLLYTVPVYLIAEEDWRAAGIEWDDIASKCDDGDWLNFFTQLGDDEALAIMQEERCR